jgi:hypothetical protein
VDDELSILQYTNGTLIFLGHGLEKAKNLMLLLCAFEKLLDLKINFHKSEIFCFGQANEMQHQYSALFGFHGGAFLFKYLGIPMHYRR